MARQCTSSRRARGHGRAAAVCVALLLMAGAATLGAQPSIVADADRAALTTLQARAEAGVAGAQFTLGSVLLYGAFDVEDAADWIRRAATAGHAAAQFELGQMLQFGVGADPSDDRAFEWYQRAADAGVPAAQRVVGDFHRQGRGGAEPSLGEAAAWYRRAADGDDLRAQYYLGQLYFDGDGVPQDYGSAYVWFALAAAQTPLPDNRKALVELRNIAAARMTPEAVDAAARRVAAWRPRLQH